jgi:hypothetical protein
VLYPELTTNDLRNLDSPGEAKVYKALKKFDTQKLRAYHSVRWLLKKGKRSAKDGETDFLVLHPKTGMITIEVKGGGVSYDANNNNWCSEDRHGIKHPIKDPILQSIKAKYSILGKVKEQSRWNLESQLSIAHSIFLPDCSETSHVNLPDLPRDIVGYREDLERIETWIEKACRYHAAEEMKGATPMHRNLFDQLFARSFKISSPLVNQLEEEEDQRISLTTNQLKALDLLRGQRRVAISGGAGTGKTLLAVEKAKRLAQEGFKTLLTCYNRSLADHLAGICNNLDNLTVLGFHQLCDQLGKKALRETGRNLYKEAKVKIPDGNRFNHWFPYVLSEAVTVLDESYDAIVCDEGQDFNSDFWIPLELLLSDDNASPFYIFFDDNQDLYHRASDFFPIKLAPFPLTMNCRNTKNIHEAAYQFYRGEEVLPPGIEGAQVKMIVSKALVSQAEEIAVAVQRLVREEHLRLKDIVVLVASSQHKFKYYSALTSASKKDLEVLKETDKTGGLRIDTVSRFKGLERKVVFLWGIDDLAEEERSELLYVGQSRAKSILYIVGSTNAVSSLAVDS